MRLRALGKNSEIYRVDLLLGTETVRVSVHFNEAPEYPTEIVREDTGVNLVFRGKIITVSHDGEAERYRLAAPEYVRLDAGVTHVFFSRSMEMQGVLYERLDV